MTEVYANLDIDARNFTDWLFFTDVKIFNLPKLLILKGC